MTAKFVAALLVATGGVKTEVNPHVPDAGETGPFQPSAKAATRARRGRADAEGMEALRRASREAWRIHQQQRGGQP